jgi:hypothetical protein
MTSILTLTLLIGCQEETKDSTTTSTSRHGLEDTHSNDAQERAQWLSTHKEQLRSSELPQNSWLLLERAHVEAQCEAMGIIDGLTEETLAGKGFVEGAWYLSMSDDMKQQQFNAFGDYHIQRNIGILGGEIPGPPEKPDYALYAPLARSDIEGPTYFVGNWMEVGMPSKGLAGEIYGFILPDQSIVGIWTSCEQS